MLVPLAPALVSVGGCGTDREFQGYASAVERRFAVTGTPDVRLSTFEGSIDVRAWDRSEVVVQVERRGPTREAVEDIAVVAEQSGGEIRVEVRRDGSFLRRRGWQTARIVASVPVTSNLLVQSGDGRITVERVTGRLEMRSDDGTIRGLELRGEIRARTADGAIRLDRVDGSVQASTGDGGVTVDGRLDGAQIRTGDGSIQLRAAPGSVVRDGWDLSTGDGGVVVYLPHVFDCDLDAETDDGVIRTEREITVSGQIGTDRRRLRGVLGEGGPSLRIRTSDGSISIRSF
jgi:DUF4097 and DUF4098 domain-containing protein YvlB